MGRFIRGKIRKDSVKFCPPRENESSTLPSVDTIFPLATLTLVCSSDLESIALGFFDSISEIK